MSADSDGPVGWCKPVPDTEAAGLAAQFPELTPSEANAPDAPDCDFAVPFA